MRSERGGNRLVRILLFGLLWTSAWVGPSVAAPSDRVAESFPGFPPAVIDLLAEQDGSSSNVMLVQAALPPQKGYARTLLVLKEGSKKKTQMAIQMSKTRTQGTQVQTHSFSWTLPSGALQMAPDLKPTSIDTRKSMGASGRVTMRLTSPTRLVRGTAPECSGNVSFRRGLLVGGLRFDARDDFFGRTELGRLEAVVMKANDFRCADDEVVTPPDCPEHLLLGAYNQESGLSIAVSKSSDGAVVQTVEALGSSGTASTVHAVQIELADPESFIVADDLTTASVDADAAASPWLSGDLEYVGTPATADEDPDCGPYDSSSGVVTGDFTAHFDSFGDAAPPTTGLSATLRRSPL